MANWTGRTLSKVEVQERMGRGGMADVYLGRHTTLERPVAVKILHAHFSEDDQLLARFRDEAQAVATLRHPNIVQVFDFDVVDDSPYIIMEYIEGIALSAHLIALRVHDRILPPETVTRIIDALAAALSYAHERGIVHRDVKPANVMLRSESGSIEPGAPLPADAQAVLTDFGVARIANVTAARTATGSVIGTPAYMSPEQVRGETVDARSDIYSLGIMLYEMLAGRTPFDPSTESTASMLIKQMNATPPPVPTAHPDVQAVIDRALAKDPDERFQKVNAFASALNVALDPSDVAHTMPMQEPMARSSAAAQTAGFTFSSIPGGLVTVGVVFGLIAAGIVLLTGVLGNNGETLSTEQAAVAATEPSDVSPAEASTSEDGSSAASDALPEESVAAPAGEGVVLFRDATVSVHLFDIIPPPDGLLYEAWLTEPGGEPLSLGIIEVSEGNASLTFSNPDGTNLTSQFSAFAISLEPVNDSDATMSDQLALQGQIDATTLERLRVLGSISRGQPTSEALISGLPNQNAQFTTHMGLSIDGINGGNVSAGKLHAEHANNIIEGRASENFADWNGDGRTENPGDDVGLGPYLLMVADAARGAAATPGLDETTRQNAQEVADSAGELALLASDSSTLARRATAADTIEEMQALVADMSQLRTEINSGVESLTTADVGELEFAITIELAPVSQ